MAATPFTDIYHSIACGDSTQLGKGLTEYAIILGGARLARGRPTADTAVPRLGQLRALLKREELVRDDAYMLSRHTLNGSRVLRALRRGEEAHVFNTDVDLTLLEQRVWNEGTYRGVLDTVRDPGQWERITWDSPTPVGRRIQPGRPDIPLNVVEIKLRQNPNGMWEYHLVPRPRPAN